MRKLQPKEVQPDKIFHDKVSHSPRESVKVLGVEMEESQSPPCQVVVFHRLGNRAEKRRLPINNFCSQYRRRKRQI